MRIFRQLIKEFWLPVMLAATWAVHNYIQSNDKKLAALINLFGGTFFFISWLTGQYFRVRKQAKSENSINNIENRTEEILSRLEKK